MQSELLALENEWLRALQGGDTATLDRLLDPAFVCMPTKSAPDLLVRSEYLRYASRRRFKNCELTGIRIVTLGEFGEFAVVESRVSCEHRVGSRIWSAQFALSDTWVRRADGWKALNRDSASSAVEGRGVRRKKVQKVS